MWWPGGYGYGYDGYGYNGYGFYGSQIILVVVILIVGCLLLCCVVGGLWLLYSRSQKERRSENVEYYPQYYPRSGTGTSGFVAKDTEFR